MNTSVSSIDGPGWYLISSSSNGSFVDVIKNYATQNYPQAKYKIYNIAFAIPTGWTEDEGNATFKNKDWNKIDNINDPSVIMEASLGYWVKILSYNSNIVTNQSQILIGCTAGFIAISNDGKGWQNLNTLGGTSFGPLPSEVPSNVLPYFSSFLFQGKAKQSPTINESLYVSSIKNIVPTEPNGAYKSEIYEIFPDNSVSTSPINSIQDAFIYNIHNLLTPNNNNYYWLLSGYSNRFVKSNPTPFYNLTNDPASLTSTNYSVEGTDWSKLNTSSFPLWASTNIKNALNPYLPGTMPEGNYKYYIKDNNGVYQWFPFNVNTALITSVDTNGESYYIVGANGFYFVPVLVDSQYTLQLNQVNSSIYYVNSSIFDDFSTIQENTSNNTKSPWLSAFSYDVAGPYQIYPKVASASFPDVNSIHNLVEGLIDNKKYVFAIQRSNNISTVYNDGVVDVSTFSDTNLEGTCVLCYCALDTLAQNAGKWSTSDSVSINNVLTVDNINIVYIQSLFYIEDNNANSVNGIWYISCLDESSRCVLLKSTTPNDTNTWSIAYDNNAQSLFPISSTSFTNPQDPDQTTPLYYQVKDIVQNEDQDQSTFLISITGTELAITLPNSENATNPVGTYYANINNDMQFTNINVSIPDVPRSNTFNSILKRDVKDIVYEIKNNESQTIIPSYISLGYAMNVLAIAGGGASGPSGSIEADPNNTNRSIINYSGSGAGGAAASFIFATANDLIITIDDQKSINLDFGTGGHAQLGNGEAGGTDIATGGTFVNEIINSDDPDSPNPYLQYDLLTNGFANGFDGLATKTIVYNDTREKAQENASKYSPDGGDGGIVTTDLDGNNYYGIGGSGTFNSIQNNGGNAYVLVRYVKWTGAIPDPVNTAAFSVAIYNSINDQTVQSYRDYVIPTDPSQYPMLIYLNEFAPKAGEEASGRILFNYALVQGADAMLILSSGAGGGGGGAASNSADDNTYYDVPNSIIDNGKAIPTGPTPGWSGKGATNKSVNLNAYPNSTITELVFKITVGGGGKGGKKYAPENDEGTLNGGNGLDSVMNIFYRNQGSQNSSPFQTISGSQGGLNGYYSNNLPTNYDLTKTGAPYGSRGNYAPNASLNLQNKITGLNESYNYPGGVINNNQLLTQLGGDGGGGTSNGIGAGGGYGNGGLPGLYSNANEGGIHGSHGGGGGGGMGGKNMASDGGNGSSGMAFLYLTGPPDYNAPAEDKPQIKEVSNLFMPIHNKNTKDIILASNFSMPLGYTTFNFALYGAGGNGATSNESNTALGGGGSGSFVEIRIPYVVNNKDNASIQYFMTEILYGIGANNVDIVEVSQTYVKITYNNGAWLQFGAVRGDDGDTTGVGGAGGISEDNKSFFYNPIAGDTIGTPKEFIVSNVDGTAGGSATIGSAKSGAVNDYTSSGAGGYIGSDGTAFMANALANIPTQTFNNEKMQVSSGGAGWNENNKSPQDAIGYGAGGAGTAGSYQNSTASIGAPGCIVYYLSGDVAPEPEPEGEPDDPPDDANFLIYTLNDTDYEYYTYVKFDGGQTNAAIASFPLSVDMQTDTRNYKYKIVSQGSLNKLGFVLIAPGGRGGNFDNSPPNNNNQNAQNRYVVCASGGAGGWAQAEYDKAVQGTYYLWYDGSNWQLQDSNNNDHSWNIYAQPGGNGGDMKTSDQWDKVSAGGAGGKSDVNRNKGYVSTASQYGLPGTNGTGVRDNQINDQSSDFIGRDGSGIPTINYNQEKTVAYMGATGAAGGTGGGGSFINGVLKGGTAPDPIRGNKHDGGHAGDHSGCSGGGCIKTISDDGGGAGGGGANGAVVFYHFTGSS